MTVFGRHDLAPLWDRPPEFLPQRPAGGAHHWSFADVRRELESASDHLDRADSERRVALLANPALSGAATVEGLNAGIQMLRAGEAAAVHRHTPAALRVGLEATDVVTMVDDREVRLEPLDVVLNPSGTWHGHEERGGEGALWLDVVDLPLVAGLGGVLFEPTVDHRRGSLLDPPSTPATVRYEWTEIAAQLESMRPAAGIRTLAYGDGSVMPTMAVTAHRFESGAVLHLPARTGGAIVLIGDGRFTGDSGSLDPFDVIGVRSWTPYSLAAVSADGIVLVIDTSPALRALGLFREERAR